MSPLDVVPSCGFIMGSPVGCPFMEPPLDLQ